MRCSAGKYSGPSGSSATSSSRSSATPSPVFALTGCSAWKSPSFEAVSICVAMCPGFSRSTLFSAITTGTPSAKTRSAMKRSPAPIRSRAESTNSTRVDVLERRVDRALHVLGQRVERPLEPGQVGEHELVVVAVRDPEDAPPRRLRLVRDDRDLAAAERVHERRLADVRAARRRRRSRTSQLEGPTCPAGGRPGVCVTISPASFRNVTASSRNSYSHCRQPPHGDAVIPIASMSPGL